MLKNQRCLVAILLFCVNLSHSTENITAAKIGDNESSTSDLTSCMCVVFRMDDIQDSFVNNAQLEAMNLFISRDQPLSLGIVMKNIGNDLRITGKVGEGSQKGLFELGLHGWDHVDYTTLSESEQKSTLNEANEKMKRIFGNSSDIFVPPYAYFNNETLKAIEELRIRILSASLFSEDFDDDNSIFNKTTAVDEISTNREKAKMANIQKSMREKNEVYHLPGMVQFKEYENGSSIKVPTDRIITEVSKNIAEFGYSVIVFHPQDLVQTDKNGKILDTGLLNSTEVHDLSQLIDTFLSKGIKLSTLSEIVGIDPRTYSYF